MKEIKQKVVELHQTIALLIGQVSIHITFNSHYYHFILF